MEKSKLRDKILKLRNSLDPTMKTIYDEIIFQSVIRLEEYQSAAAIYCYIDFKNEVSTEKIIAHAFSQQKKVAVPKIDAGKMNFYYIKSFDDLTPGYYNIMEPATDQIADEHGFMILPGVAFDKQGHRIGYGGGFYDKYLSAHRDLYKAAIAYDFQILDSITFEPHDIPIDILISEKGRIKYE